MEDADSPCDEHSSIRLVIAAARKSSPVKQHVVAKLLQRCHRMYQFFQDTIHPTMHDCSDHIGCPAEEMDLVFNGLSSNENLATNQWQNFDLLSDKLSQVKAEALDCTVVILCSSQDGCFTNASGIQEYFRNFIMLDIVLIVLHGHSQWTEYPIRDILAAIHDVSNGQVVETPSHRHVVGWIKISLYKEQAAGAFRNLKQVLPSKRNAVAIDDQRSEEPPAVIKYAKSETTGRLRADYLPEISSSNPKISRVAEASSPEHRNAPEEAVMASENNYRKLFVVTTETQKSLKKHKNVLSAADDISRAVPSEYDQRRGKPQHMCAHNGCGKAFGYNKDLRRHQDIHNGTRYVCHFCGADFSSQGYAKAHQRDHCKLASVSVKHKCPECDMIFKSYVSMRQHIRKAHVRGNEVKRFAQLAGFDSAAVHPAQESSTSTEQKC